MTHSNNPALILISHYLLFLVKVTGEATYTDDVKHSTDILVAALVTSAKPHAKLVGAPNPHSWKSM